MRLTPRFDLVNRHPRHLHIAINISFHVRFEETGVCAHLGPSIGTLLILCTDVATERIRRRTSLQQPRPEPYAHNLLDEQFHLILKFRFEIGKILWCSSCETLDR